MKFKKILLTLLGIVLAWETYVAIVGFKMFTYLMLSYLPHIIVIGVGWHYLIHNWRKK